MERIYPFLERGALIEALDDTPCAEHWHAADPQAFMPKVRGGPQQHG